MQMNTTRPAKHRWHKEQGFVRPRRLPALPIIMPTHGQRVSVKYGEPFLEFHGTVFHLEGYNAAESILVAFDDGDTHRFTVNDIKMATDAGGWYVVDEHSSWFGKGCIRNMECTPVAGILANKPPRARRVKLEGIWIGAGSNMGKDSIATYETFIAVPGCRPEYHSMPLGAIVVMDDELMVCMRAMRIPLTDEASSNSTKPSKYRMAALVVPLAEAWPGAVPCLTLAFMGSKTAWRVVPLSKITHVGVTNTDTLNLHAPKDEFKEKVWGESPFLILDEEKKLLPQLQKFLSSNTLFTGAAARAGATSTLAVEGTAADPSSAATGSIWGTEHHPLPCFQLHGDVARAARRANAGVRSCREGP